MFLVLAIVAAMGVTALQGSLEDAGQDREVDSETFVPSAGSVTTLDESARAHAYYTDDPEVRDENGTIMREGTDYEWFESNGTIKTLAGGGLDGDSSATINYSYQVTTEEQRGIASALGQIPRVVGIALPLGAVLFVLAAMRGGA